MRFAPPWEPVAPASSNRRWPRASCFPSSGALLDCWWPFSNKKRGIGWKPRQRRWMLRRANWALQDSQPRDLQTANFT
jgi:hypothetical protein